MEATGAYGRNLACFLAQQQLLISVVNPAQIHAFGKTELTRAKTEGPMPGSLPGTLAHANADGVPDVTGGPAINR